ncbi:MAG: amidohydrolase family protein [Bacteroidia bacterium]|nr:amidohydrolase family protein [Bacteroidia bacterium]
MMYKLLRTFCQGLRIPVFLYGLGLAPALAQESRPLPPVSRVYALEHVTVIPAPGRKLEDVTIIVRDGLIVDIGKGIAVPGEASRIAADSMYVYAGFIEGMSHTGIPRPKEDESGSAPRVSDPGNPPHQVAGIQPERTVAEVLKTDDKSIETMRQLGFTLAHVAPRGNMLPGSTALVLLSGKDDDAMLYKTPVGAFSQLAPARRVYPNTTMGVMAMWRTLYRQAELGHTHEKNYASNPVGMARPAYEHTVRALYPLADKSQAVYFRADQPLDPYRIMTLQRELGFRLVLTELVHGTSVIPDIKAGNIPVYLSLDLPERPKPVSNGADSLSAAAQEKAALEKRQAEARTSLYQQAAAFAKAGIPFGFSTLKLKDKDFRTNLLLMIEHGLSEDQALAALTTNPAAMLGISQAVGTVEKGKMANLVITDKPFFTKEAQVRFVMVEGDMFMYEATAKNPKSGAAADTGSASVSAVGTWSYTTETPQGSSGGTIVIEDKNGTLSGTFDNDQADSPTSIESVSLNGNVLTLTFSVNADGQQLPITVEVTLSGDTMTGTLSVASFGTFPLEGTRTAKPD